MIWSRNQTQGSVLLYRHFYRIHFHSILRSCLLQSSTLVFEMRVRFFKWGYIWDSTNNFSHSKFSVVCLFFITGINKEGRPAIEADRLPSFAVRLCWIQVGRPLLDASQVWWWISLCCQIILCYLRLPCWHIIILGHSHFLARGNVVHGSTPNSILVGLSLGHSTAKQDSLWSTWAVYKHSKDK